MKKKSTSQSAFFNLRVLIGLFTVLAGVFLALVGFGAFSAQAQQQTSTQSVNSLIHLLPPGFDGLGAGLLLRLCRESAKAHQRQKDAGQDCKQSD